MTTYQPYTYHIAWSGFDKHYYGARYKKNCNPKDLWVTYFTSSKHVAEFRKLHGEPDIVEIRKIFKSAENALNWEQRVLKKLKIKSNDKWLNVAIGKPSMKGKKHSLETIQKMKKPKPDGFGEKIRQFQKTYVKTQEHKKNLSLSQIGKKLKEESVAKRSKTYRERFEQGLYNVGASRLGKKRGPYKKKEKNNE
jgi:hypothetical protein